jgi:terminase small subunit-like protein
MTRRDVFEKMIATYGKEIAYRCHSTGRWEYNFSQPTVKQGYCLPEDCGWCDRARDCGFKMYGDRQVMLRHVGTAIFPLVTNLSANRGGLLSLEDEGQVKMNTDDNNTRTGRHTLKTPELCKEICDRLSQGETLTDICRDAAMPDWSTVHRWLTRDDAFRNDLTRAREQ